MKIFRIKNIMTSHLYSFKFWQLSGHNIPGDYFFKAKTYVQVNKRLEMIAGYSFIDNNKRVVAQIPAETPSILRDLLDFSTIEISGFFIKKGINPVPILIHLAINSLLQKKEKFIYSYDVDNKYLENLYKNGNPFRLYSGNMQYSEDQKVSHIENVEILSKYGICKIALNIIKRKLLNGFSSKKKV